MTWIVVIGSSSVMLAWIAVYSFFPSSDFVNEVTVLFGEIVFWATVLVSIFIALGQCLIVLSGLNMLLTRQIAPRYLIKFFTTSYLPMDKDIVREMWVSGDLKDRLGIKHRKSHKNAGSKLEFTPMFHEPYSRSVSEVSVTHDEYEPRIPGSTSPSKTETLFDPPHSQTGDIEMQAHTAFVITKPSFDADDTTPIATISRDPIRNSNGPPSPNSPHPSYYSVSDIPIPSPPPEPVYRYTTGEIASSPPTRATSLYTVQGDAGPRSSAATQLPYSLQAAQSNIDSRHSGLSSGSTYSGSYEMRVRSPPHDQSEDHLAPIPHHHSDPSRGISEASYATADNEWLDDGSHDRHGFAGHHQDGSHIDDDQTTIIQNDRQFGVYGYDRPVSGASWDGGLAL
jgi:phospholipid-translocating ATPase